MISAGMEGSGNIKEERNKEAPQSEEEATNTSVVQKKER